MFLFAPGLRAHVELRGNIPPLRCCSVQQEVFPTAVTANKRADHIVVDSYLY